MIHRLRHIVFDYLYSLPISISDIREFISVFNSITGVTDEDVLKTNTNSLSLRECQDMLAHLNERTARQKKDGVYYTPEDLTEYMVLNAFNCYSFPGISNVVDSEVLYNTLGALSEKAFSRLIRTSVFDPTCGAGEFLLSALRIKLSLLRFKKSSVTDSDIIRILSSIKGNDIEKVSVIIAKSRLLLECYSYLTDKKKVYDLLHAMDNNFTTDDYVATVRNKVPLYDIMLGNPPYFEYSTLSYTPEGGFGNVYCDVLNNVCQESSTSGVMAFVVPLSYISTPRMKRIRDIIGNEFGKQFVMSFADRPDCLFVSAHQKLCIIVAAKRSTKETKGVYTSTYYYWYKSERNLLFHDLTTSFNQEIGPDCFPKLGNEIEVSLFNKTHGDGDTLLRLMSATTDTKSLYLNMRGCFWMKVFSKSPGSNEYKAFSVCADNFGYIACILNSSLFFTQWIALSDCWHITRKDFKSFIVPDISSEKKDIFNE